MIEGEDFKVAENKEEELLITSIENTEKRIRENKFVQELDEVILEYLKNKHKKSNP